ncbi:MAG: hypothetical protein U5N85_18620 [Arcicella sp.]|nr:hypothetical protein [Arcicella sp.]
MSEGNYWFWTNKAVFIYEKGDLFHPPIDLNILLKENEIVEALMIIEVADNEIAIQFEDKRFKTILTAGRYAFWKGVKNYTFTKADLSNIEIDATIDTQLMTNKFMAYVRPYTIESFEKALLIVDGKFERILEGRNLLLVEK